MLRCKSIINNIMMKEDFINFSVYIEKKNIMQYRFNKIKE